MARNSYDPRRAVRPRFISIAPTYLSLNRSRNHPMLRHQAVSLAAAYQQARRTAIADGINVQHQTVR